MDRNNDDKKKYTKNSITAEAFLVWGLKIVLWLDI